MFAADYVHLKKVKPDILVRKLPSPDWIFLISKFISDVRRFASA